MRYFIIFSTDCIFIQATAMHGRFHGIFVENIFKYKKPVEHFQHIPFDIIIINFIQVFVLFLQHEVVNNSVSRTWYSFSRGVLGRTIY